MDPRLIHRKILLHEFSLRELLVLQWIFAESLFRGRVSAKFPGGLARVIGARPREIRPVIEALARAWVIQEAGPDTYRILPGEWKVPRRVARGSAQGQGELWREENELKDALFDLCAEASHAEEASETTYEANDPQQTVPQPEIPPPAEKSPRSPGGEISAPSKRENVAPLPRRFRASPESLEEQLARWKRTWPAGSDPPRGEISAPSTYTSTFLKENVRRPLTSSPRRNLRALERFNDVYSRLEHWAREHGQEIGAHPLDARILQALEEDPETVDQLIAQGQDQERRGKRIAKVGAWLVGALGRKKGQLKGFVGR